MGMQGGILAGEAADVGMQGGYGQLPLGGSWRRFWRNCMFRTEKTRTFEKVGEAVRNSNQKNSISKPYRASWASQSCEASNP